MALYDDSKTLLDKQFRLPSVTKELETQPFTIVHIASHAQFRANVEESFLLTYDDKLTLNELQRIIGRFRFRDEPLELLTLSACQTAAGDDRAALGLGGLPLRPGPAARSPRYGILTMRRRQNWSSNSISNSKKRRPLVPRLCSRHNCGCSRT